MAIIIQQALIEGVFLERRNRFIGLVAIAGEGQIVHITNTGRMRELLLPGARVLLKPAGNPLRKTQFSLYMVFHNGIWVALDSTAANVLLYEALLHKGLSMFAGYHQVRREVGYGAAVLMPPCQGMVQPAILKLSAVRWSLTGKQGFPMHLRNGAASMWRN